MEKIYFDEKIDQNEELTEKNSENKLFITFAKIDKYFIFPFLYALFNFLYNLFSSFIYDTGVYKKPELIDSIFFELSFVLAGFFYFVPNFQVNINMSKIPTNKNKSSKFIDYLYNKSIFSKIKTSRIIILNLLLGLMNAINDVFYVLIYSDSGVNVFNGRLFHLFFLPLFCKIILKENIYKHQYFSLLISLTGSIFFIIPVCFKVNGKDIVPNILNFIKVIIFSLFIVLIKYLVEKYYVPPLKICLLIGIISIIFNVLGYSIYCLITNDFRYFTDCFDFSNVENKLVISIYFIFYFIFAVASILTLFLSLFYFSPTIIMITFIISPLFSFIKKTITTSVISEINTIETILNSIGYLITLFSALIYNELIIFNCCGLNRNTKKFVNKRIYKELEEIKTAEHNLLFLTDDDFLKMNDNKE